MYIHIHTYTYIHTYAYIYIYIYIYTHTYIYRHTHIHTYCLLFIVNNVYCCYKYFEYIACKKTLLCSDEKSCKLLVRENLFLRVY